MSILFSLRQFIDPERAGQERTEIHIEQRRPRREDATPPGGSPDRFACRVCGREEPEGAFCPSCLADTMVALPRSRGGDDDR